MSKMELRCPSSKFVSIMSSTYLGKGPDVLHVGGELGRAKDGMIEYSNDRA